MTRFTLITEEFLEKFFIGATNDGDTYIACNSLRCCWETEILSEWSLMEPILVAHQHYIHDHNYVAVVDGEVINRDPAQKLIGR